MYSHAFWSRNAKTEPGVDFENLPKIQGKGRYLDANLALISDPRYGDTWWGEGEAKIYRLSLFSTLSGLFAKRGGGYPTAT
jgi:hypothetical protein